MSSRLWAQIWAALQADRFWRGLAVGLLAGVVALAWWERGAVPAWRAELRAAEDRARTAEALAQAWQRRTRETARRSDALRREEQALRRRAASLAAQVAAARAAADTAASRWEEVPPDAKPPEAIALVAALRQEIAARAALAQADSAACALVAADREAWRAQAIQAGTVIDTLRAQLRAMAETARRAPVGRGTGRAVLVAGLAGFAAGALLLGR